MNFEQQKTEILALMKKMHAGQLRAGNVPVWHHLARVSRTLEVVLANTQEGTKEERQAIVLAGFGHDALEDTDVIDEQIIAVSNERALALIKGMTNTEGDDHQTKYVEQVTTADEGTRLIKLSDLYDNLSGATFNMSELGVEWQKTYFLPIVEPMISALLPTSFTHFPDAAERLKGQVIVAYDRIKEEITRFKE